MKVITIVPDGVGVRNFVFGPLLDLLSAHADVTAWHALPERVAESLQAETNGRARWTPLPTFREGIPERVLRRAKVYAQLYWQKEPGLDLVLKMLRPAGRWLDIATGQAARAAGYLGASAQGNERIDRWHAWFTARAPYLERFVEFLEAEKPDCLFCTHQRASSAVPAMVAAQKLGIPTATFIYSWDNLPKGRMAVQADHFLLWSDRMRDEMLRYYPEVSPDRLHVVGTPQFEFHCNQALRQPRDVFLRRLGLAPHKPVVCFSGCDVPSSPYDPLFLRDLALALRKSPEASRPQLLFRPCPTESLDRYREVLGEYSEIIVSKPAWRRLAEEDWTQVVPTAEDVALLANVASHCDLVVNFGSTMAIDFALHDRPAIYLAYEPAGGGVDPKWKATDAYQLPHQKLIHEVQLVHWADSAEGLPGLVDHVLRNPGEKALARRECVTQIAAQPFSEASQRCCEALLAITGQRVELCTSVF
jgi:hypothetical protein